MPPARDLPDREIRTRKDMLYDVDQPGDGATMPRRAFADVLRETPPAALSTGVKAALIAAGVVVALLFGLSLLKMLQPKRKPATPAPAAIHRPTSGRNYPDLCTIAHQIPGREARILAGPRLSSPDREPGTPATHSLQI